MRSVTAASSKRHSSIRRPDNHITQPPSERLSQERQAVAEKRVMVRHDRVGRSSAISCGERKPCWFDGWKPHRRWRPHSSAADCIAQCVQEFGPRFLLDREPAEIRTRITRWRQPGAPSKAPPARMIEEIIDPPRRAVWSRKPRCSRQISPTCIVKSKERNIGSLRRRDLASGSSRSNLSRPVRPSAES